MEATAITIAQAYDIIICGGGLAGITLARQIAREIPDASLLLLEGKGGKSHTAAINVGESTVELSGHYLADVLDLRENLEAVHFHKMGFRFFFSNGNGNFHERAELGLANYPPLDSFQIDRARLESDIKQLNAAMGIKMLAESKVEEIALADGDGLHKVTFVDGCTNQKQIIACRWVVDAMGRRRFLQKKLGLTEAERSNFSAAWFRLEGRLDVCDLVPRTEKNWHSRIPNDNRYYSTNHLMDNGRWVWLIPLGTGATSIGIVAHEGFFPFSEYNTYERALLWLQQHEPGLRRLIGERRPLDFQCLRHYSYSAKQVFSTERWACTGDAAIFSDPFLSPGIDQLGFANTIITELIKRDRADRLRKETIEYLNGVFLSFNAGTTWVIQSAYPFFGESLVIGVKLFWDIARGWAINGPQRFNRIYMDEQKALALQPFLSRLFLLTTRMEQMFKGWAMRTQRKYSYQFVDYLGVPGVKELYVRNLQTNKKLGELVSDHRMTLDFFEEMAQKIFFLALADTMPEMIAQLPSPLWLNAWGIGLDPKRWMADKLFAPTSKPRPLGLAQFASMFGVTDLGLQFTRS